jgi:glutaminyl-tRNA synthetase
MAQFDAVIRDDLNKRALRRMAVLKPLKLVIDNYPEGQTEMLEAVNNPEDPAHGTRQVPFSKVLYIEQDDFREVPPAKYFRLSPGREVRLRGTYFLKCERVVKNEQGEVVELRCTYDPATRDGSSPDGRKVKATIHWVSAAHAVDAEVRLYDRLFTVPDLHDAEEGRDWKSYLNPHSLEVLQGCKLEPGLVDVAPLTTYQFERLGYYCVDPDTSPGRLVFNRTVPLRDTWARVASR